MLLSVQVWVVLWRRVHTGHSHTHSCVMQLTPELPQVPWCPCDATSCCIASLPCCYATSVVLSACSHSSLRLWTLVVDLAPSNVGATACDNPSLLCTSQGSCGWRGVRQLEDMQADERVEVGGTQHTRLSDTAVYSSLQGSVGSVHDNH